METVKSIGTSIFDNIADMIELLLAKSANMSNLSFMIVVGGDLGRNAQHPLTQPVCRSPPVGG
jgi:hypothetical protein